MTKELEVNLKENILNGLSDTIVNVTQKLLINYLNSLLRKKPLLKLKSQKTMTLRILLNF